MLLRVPYTFTANVVLPRKINSRQTTQGAFLTVEIPELDDIEAPIATAWTNYRYETFQTRWHDGSHWLPHTDYDKDGNSYPVTTNILLEKLSKGERGTSLTAGAESSLRSLLNGDLEPFDERNFRSVVETDQNAVINKILDSAKDCIIVDNQLWKRCGEPYYKHNRKNIIRETDPAVVYPDICFLHDEAAVDRTAFSADQFEDFIEFAVGPNRDRYIMTDDFKITVFIPESIKFDADALVLVNETGNFLKRSARNVGEHSPAYIHAWAELKSTHEAATHDRREYACDQLAEAIQGLSAASPSADYFLDVLNDVANRWRHRPIEIADSFRL